MAAASFSQSAEAIDPLAGVDYIIVIDNGAHNIRIASIPYPFSRQAISAATSVAGSSSDSSFLDPSLLAQSIAIDVFPNAIARTRTPHTIPSLSASEVSPTAPAAGSKTSIFVSSHIHSLLDDYAALHLRLPHQSGIVVDWAAQKTIWDHVLTNHLAKLPGGIAKRGKLLAGKAVIMTEAYLNLEPAQHATDLLLFEHYGAQAVSRTSAAALIGLGTNVFRSDLPLSRPTKAANLEAPSQKEASSPEIVMEQGGASSTKRPLRTSRASATTTINTAEPSISLPRILTIPRPQSMLVLDLGYSYCHTIPIINGVVHHSSVRRLELGGKMLINLLKETLSFKQLDMMDESWLMSHIFAKTSFVAAEVGHRVYGADDRVKSQLEAVERKHAALWTYNDLLLMSKFGKAKGSKSISVTWSLPDYGGVGGRTEVEQRNRARYGLIVDGPNPPAYAAYAASQKDRNDDGSHLTKRPRFEARFDWESSFIASTTATTTTARRASTPCTDKEEDDHDLQTLTLATERFSIIENLFNPGSLGLDQKPLPELILDSITSVSTSDLPSARTAADMMWSNIVLAGGLANTVNMSRRLNNELASLAPADVPLRIWPDEQREVDKALLAIQAGVVMACEMSVRQAFSQETVQNGVAGSAKKKPRTSRAEAAVNAAATANANGLKIGKGAAEARWLTYTQWINPTGSAGGGGADADIVKAANRVFYPSASQVAARDADGA